MTLLDLDLEVRREGSGVRFEGSFEHPVSVEHSADANGGTTIVLNVLQIRVSGTMERGNGHTMRITVVGVRRVLTGIAWVELDRSEEIVSIHTHDHRDRGCGKRPLVGVHTLVM